MSRELKRLHVPLATLQLKTPQKKDDDDGRMLFSGYGARFGNRDSYDDVIEKGALAEYIKKAYAGEEPWPAMLLQHGGWEAESQMPVGAWLSMAEDEKGLYLEGELANIQRGVETYTLMKMQPRPAISGLSIGYYADEWIINNDPDEPRRTLKRITLAEVSIVTFPANNLAGVIDVKHAMPQIRAAEHALRDAGFSRAEAKAILASGYKSLPPRDAGAEAANDELAALIANNISLLQH